MPAARDSAAAAAQPPVPVDATFRVNTRGTSFVLEAARSVGTKVVAFASTASVLLAPRSLRSWLRSIPSAESHELRPRLRDLRRGPPLGGVSRPHHLANGSGNPRFPVEARPPGDRGNRALVVRHYPEFRQAAEPRGPDDLILAIRRARAVLGYVPRHSWRGPEVGERIS